MKISVIIPVFNEEKYIESCLQSLLAQKRPADEIIVVDNNSTDKTVEIVKKYPVKIVSEKKQGMIPARNKGFNTATGDIIARTDGDTRVPKTWLSYIENQFKDPQLVALSGPGTFADMPIVAKASNLPSQMFFELFKQMVKHDCLFGPNMAIRKSAWEKIKNEVCLKDKDVHEDLDLAIHIARVGKVKFDQKLVVRSSPRRFKKLSPYFDYPYRQFSTIQRHNATMVKLQKSRRMVTKALSKKSIKHAVSTVLSQLN